LSSLGTVAYEPDDRPLDSAGKEPHGRHRIVYLLLPCVIDW